MKYSRTAFFFLWFLASTVSATTAAAADPSLEVIPGTEINYGQVATGSNVLVGPGGQVPFFIIRNTGTETLTLTLTATLSGGMTLGGHLGDTGIDRCVFAGVFSDYSQPLVLGMFADNDVLVPETSAATATRYAVDADLQSSFKGYDVGPGQERQLRFLLQSPTLDTTYGAPQTLYLTLSSLEHPSETVICELTFSIPCGCYLFEVPVFSQTYGAVERNTNTVSNPDPRWILRNITSRTLNFVVSASVTGGMSLGNQLGDVGSNRCVLAGVFTDFARTLAPGDFGDEDVIGGWTPASLTALACAGDAVEVKGISVGPYQERTLRFLLQAPTQDTTGGAEQTIHLSFRCFEDVAFPLSAELTFRIDPGTPTTTPTVTPTPTISATSTTSPTATPTPSRTETPTESPSASPTTVATDTPTPTPTESREPTATFSPTSSATPACTPTATETGTPLATSSPTATATATAEASPSPVGSAPVETKSSTVSAYPNPARGQVHFVYAVPDAARITIDIFRLDGERVATLAERPVCGAGGTFTTAWRAAGVAPGVYLCLIRITDSAGRELVRQTRKVALLQ